MSCAVHQSTLCGLSVILYFENLLSRPVDLDSVIFMLSLNVILHAGIVPRTWFDWAGHAERCRALVFFFFKYSHSILFMRNKLPAQCHAVTKPYHLAVVLP